MQQPICQPDQMSQQQAQQQVMLCPVRLVYETQILVQPGDQIHPNQTLFINPQNTPPWIQNRPQPSQQQVIYVQQMPNNIVPAIQQPMDPNQMYLQNFANYQQMQMNQMNQIQEQMRANMQMNMLQSNMMPVANIASNVQNENAGQSLVSYPTVANVPNANIANVNNEKQNIQMNQNLVNMQKVVDMQMRPMPQNQIVRPQMPQIMTVSPMQSNVPKPSTSFSQFVPTQPRSPRPTINTVNASMQTVNNIQGIIRTNIQTNNISTATSDHAINSMQAPSNNIVQPNKANKIPLPATITKASSANIITNQGVRHYSQTYAYRPIQPRPMGVAPMRGQYMPQNINQNVYQNNIRPHNANTSSNIDADVIMRKRKSESPDEIRKKIPNMSSGINTVNIQYSDSAKETYSEIRQILQRPLTTSTGTQANVAKAKNIQNVPNLLPPNKFMQSPTVAPNNVMLPNNTIVQNNIIMPNNNLLSNNIIVAHNTSLPSNVIGNSDTDKLVRNTVFTQARGILRTETQVTPIEMKIESNQPRGKLETTTVENKQIVKNDNELKSEEKPKQGTTEVTKTAEVPKAPINQNREQNITKIKEDSKQINEKKDEQKSKSSPTKIPTADTSKMIDASSQVTNEVNPKKEEHSKEITKLKDKEEEQVVSKRTNVTSISDLKGNELHIAEGSVGVQKEDPNSYVLTHVLDGYVIQESNIAFPIRKPLIEKTLYLNKHTSEPKKEEFKHVTDEGKSIKDNSKILMISDLNLNEEKRVKTDEVKEDMVVEDDLDNPFKNITTSIVKSWTIDELATHLLKYKWTKTISVLSEHEIDGESLFLVSKQQLIQIGVIENHADIICEFIKN